MHQRFYGLAGYLYPDFVTGHPVIGSSIADFPVSERTQIKSVAPCSFFYLRSKIYLELKGIILLFDDDDCTFNDLKLKMTPFICMLYYIPIGLLNSRCAKPLKHNNYCSSLRQWDN